MKVVLVSLFSLFVSTMLLAGGNGFLSTLLSVRLALDGISPDVIGGVMLFYSVGFVAGTLISLNIVARVGHIRSFAVFSALLSISALIYPISHNLVLWGILRVAAGFSAAGILVVIESWIGSAATNKNRGSLFAIYQICFYLAVASGQLLVSVGDPLGFVPFSVAAILLTAAIIPLSAARIQAPVVEKIHYLSLGEMWRISTISLTSAFINGMLLSSFYALGPVYANSIGFSVDQISLYMAVAVTCAMLLAWPVGRVCDHYERYHVLLCLVVLAAICATANMLLAGGPPLTIVLTSGLYVGLISCIYPICVAMTNDRMESDQIVPASATLLLCYGAGACLGPLLSAVMMRLYDPYGLFISGLLLLLVLLVVLLIRGRVRTIIPVEEQTEFVTNLPEGTPVIKELDPRHDTSVSPQAD